MRLTIVVFVFILVGCSQSRQTQPVAEIQDTTATDAIIGSVSVKVLEPYEGFNWENLTQLMQSLEEIPFEQRNITLKTLKDEAMGIYKKPWREAWDSNPIRSRYNVFVTHLSLAADQRYGENAPLKQAQAIVKMKQSWNIFATQLHALEASAVLETTLR